jgi:uncharacterized protein YkwD
MKRFCRASFITGLLVLVFLLPFANSLPAVSVLGTSAFSDLSSAWAQEEISNLVSAEVLSGYPDGSFKPDNPLTRAEFIKMIVSAFSSPSQAPASFRDVSPDFWATPYIAQAQVKGWVNGYPDGSFFPQENVTRAQVLAVLVRIAGWPDERWTQGVAPSGWASSQVAAAWSHGVLMVSDPYLDLTVAFADVSASRQEVAAFMQRVRLQVLGVSATPATPSPQPTAMTAVNLGVKEQQMLELDNQARQQAGLVPLVWDERLASFADDYARQMGENDFFNHTSPLTGSFQQRAQTLFADGYTLVGENLGKAQNTNLVFGEAQLISSIQDGFLQSPTHKANILGNWNRVGLGFFAAGETFLVVQVYGTR